MPETRARAASRASSESFPRRTALVSERSSAARTAATFSADRATKIVSYPALLNTSMIPVAIVPEPTTPTFSTVRPGT